MPQKRTGSRRNIPSLIFKPRVLDLTDKRSSIQNPKFFGAAFG